jgi:hypothetical protein
MSSFFQQAKIICFLVDLVVEFLRLKYFMGIGYHWYPVGLYKIVLFLLLKCPKCPKWTKIFTKNTEYAYIFFYCLGNRDYSSMQFNWTLFSTQYLKYPMLKSTAERVRSNSNMSEIILNWTYFIHSYCGLLLAKPILLPQFIRTNQVFTLS